MVRPDFPSEFLKKLSESLLILTQDKRSEDRNFLLRSSGAPKNDIVVRDFLYYIDKIVVPLIDLDTFPNHLNGPISFISARDEEGVTYDFV